MPDLKGKKALITGASSGFGADFAKILASMGADLIIVARREEKLLEVKEHLENEYGISVKVIVRDLTGYDAAKELFDETVGEDIEILINNAGFGMYDYLINQEAEKVNSMIQLNVTALTALTNLFGKKMVEKDYGYILNVASFAAFNPTPFYAAYGATKAYVMNFSVAFNTELGKTGSNVVVSVFCPGYTRTEFVKTAGQKKSAFLEKALGDSFPAAQEAIDGLFRKKPVIMPRFLNKSAAFLLKFMTRKKAAEMVFSSIRKDQK